MQARLGELLESALQTLRERGVVPPDTAVAIQVERPREEGHGEFASNLAMRLAKPAGQKPRDLAQALVDALPPAPEVARVEVAGPGFINFHLAESVFQAVVPEVLRAGAAFGRGDAGAGERVQIEFVSANPTGPLHVGHGRGAAYGDALARIMAAAVAHVQGAGGVGGDELDLDALAVAGVAAAEGRPGAQRFGNHRLEHRFGQVEVDEARPRHLHPRHLGGCGQGRHQRLGELARRLAGGLGQAHGEIAGEVAVALLARALHLHLGLRVGGDNAAVAEGLEGASEELDKSRLHGGSPVASGPLGDRAAGMAAGA